MDAGRARTRGTGPASLLALGLVFVAACAGEAAPARKASQERQNVIRSIRQENGGKHFVVEVAGRDPFRPGALDWVLRVGKREFRQSRYPADGSTRTLLFSIPAAEFGALASGEPVSVYYGSPGRNERQLGKLNKSLLKP